MTIRRKPVELLPRGPEKPRDRLVETIEGAAPGSVMVIVPDALQETALWGGLLAADELLLVRRRDSVTR